MICSVPCRVPDPRLLRACSPRLVTTASASAAIPKTSNAWPAAHRWPSVQENNANTGTFISAGLVICLRKRGRVLVNYCLDFADAREFQIRAGKDTRAGFGF